jgi:hypothetical protein
MRSKLAISALVVASLFGATAIVSAQSDPAQPATGASGEGSAGTGSTKAPHRMKSSHMKPGVTTGMSTRSSTEKSKSGGQSTARKPAAN